MTNDEMNAFLHEIAKKMKPGCNIDDVYKNLVEPLRVFAEAANKTKNNIDWNSVCHSLQTFADIMARIPEEVRETRFFCEVDKFSKYKDYELSHENIQWFLEDIRNEVLIEETDYFARDDNSAGAVQVASSYKVTESELTKYIYQIKEDSNLNIREKVIILLAHMEPLIFETLDHEKLPHENLKTTVRKITVDDNRGMSEESLAKVYVYGISSIIFARTDFFPYSIDKRMPFRNNILHNGVVDYTDEQLDSAYGVLSDFIDALVILKHWIPAKGDSYTQ